MTLLVQTWSMYVQTPLLLLLILVIIISPCLSGIIVVNGQCDSDEAVMIWSSSSSDFDALTCEF
jgi:hypothetical protein